MIAIIKTATCLCSVRLLVSRTVVSKEIHNLFCKVNEQGTKTKHCKDLVFVQMLDVPSLTSSAFCLIPFNLPFLLAKC